MPATDGGKWQKKKKKTGVERKGSKTQGRVNEEPKDAQDRVEKRTKKEPGKKGVDGASQPYTKGMSGAVL